MKRFASLFLALSFAGAAYGQLQNGGFEEWTAGNPNNWLTPNIPNIMILVEEVTHTHYEGHSSARLSVTRAIPGSFVMQSTGRINVEDRVTLELYYAVMTDSLIGTASIAGYLDGEARDIGGGEYRPAGDNFNRMAVNWSPQLDAFDSLLITIAVGNAGVLPRDGSVLIDGAVLTGVSQVSVREDRAISPPNSPNLISIYPNPFNSDAAIRFDAGARNATLSLIDPSGRMVGMLPAGPSGKVLWSQFAGRTLPAGRYTIVLSANGKSSALAAVYLK